MKLVCSDGNRQAQKAILCKEWFDYDTTAQTRQDVATFSSRATVTDKAKAWLSRNGFAPTKTGMCSASAPWPLDKKNRVEVRAVCQVICDYCKNGFLVRRPPTPPIITKIVRTMPPIPPTIASATLPPIITTAYYRSTTTDYNPATTTYVYHYAGTF